MSVHDLFDPQALETIRAATARTEKRTAGEVVTYVVGRCDDYEESRWLGALFGALVAALGTALWHRATENWGLSELWLAAPPFVGAAIGFALVRWIPAIERLLLREDAVARRVEARAAAAFLEEEIFDTRERTGVLIFVAHFEHRVVILRDAGINARVAAGAWEEIADDVARGIRDGRATEALERALGRCGDLLAEHGVERRADDVDELANDVRVRDR